MTSHLDGPEPWTLDWTQQPWDSSQRFVYDSSRPGGTVAVGGLIRDAVFDQDHGVIWWNAFTDRVEAADPEAARTWRRTAAYREEESS